MVLQERTDIEVTEEKLDDSDRLVDAVRAQRSSAQDD